MNPDELETLKKLNDEVRSQIHTTEFLSYLRKIADFGTLQEEVDTLYSDDELFNDRCQK